MCVLDGEIVHWADGRPAFTALQHRPAARGTRGAELARAAQILPDAVGLLGPGRRRRPVHTPDAPVPPVMCGVGYMVSLMPRPGGHTLAGQAVKNPAIMPICMRDQ
jgi:hypothetical protein